MSDLDRFVAMYASLGITCVIVPYEKESQIILCGQDYGEPEHTRSEKFDGYNGFYSNIRFDANGAFVSQGFWE